MALAFALSGCGSINAWMSTEMADHMPQWAGGPPKSAPPRPGTSAYDDFLKTIGAPVPAAAPQAAPAVAQPEPPPPPPEISKKAIF